MSGRGGGAQPTVNQLREKSVESSDFHSEYDVYLYTVSF